MEKELQIPRQMFTSSTPGSLHGWILFFPPFLPLSQLQQHIQPLFSIIPGLDKHPGQGPRSSSNHNTQWEFLTRFLFGMQIFLPGSSQIPHSATAQLLKDLRDILSDRSCWSLALESSSIFLGKHTKSSTARSCPLRNFRSSWGKK